jgi:hypothetical protein
MIISALFYIIWLILYILSTILATIPVAIPPNVAASFAYFAGYLRYASGIIDIAGVMLAFRWLVDFMVGWFTFKVAMLLYHLVASRRVHETQALPAQAKHATR